MCVATQFTIDKIQNQPRGPTADEQAKDIWYIDIMEYYSAITKNETLSLTTKWSQLVTIMLSEISQSSQDKHYVSSLICDN